MSQIANIIVYDGASTPVVHTLKPIEVSRENGKLRCLWREELANLPVSAQVRVEGLFETLKSGVTRSEIRVVVPVMETVSGENAAGYTAAPKVAYEDTDVYIKYSHPRSSITGRRLSRQMLVNLMNNVTSTVAAATSGPVPELADNQIFPT